MCVCVKGEAGCVRARGEGGGVPLCECVGEGGVRVCACVSRVFGEDVPSFLAFLSPFFPLLLFIVFAVHYFEEEETTTTERLQQEKH